MCKEKTGSNAVARLTLSPFEPMSPYVRSHKICHRDCCHIWFKYCTFCTKNLNESLSANLWTGPSDRTFNARVTLKWNDQSHHMWWLLIFYEQTVIIHFFSTYLSTSLTFPPM